MSLAFGCNPSSDIQDFKVQEHRISRENLLPFLTFPSSLSFALFVFLLRQLFTMFVNKATRVMVYQNNKNFDKNSGKEDNAHPVSIHSLYHRIRHHSPLLLYQHSFVMWFLHVSFFFTLLSCNFLGVFTQQHQEKNIKFIEKNIMHHIIGEDHYDSHGSRIPSNSSLDSGTEVTKRDFIITAVHERKDVLFCQESHSHVLTCVS
jgi:hypothetical protein